MMRDIERVRVHITSPAPTEENMDVLNRMSDFVLAACERLGVLLESEGTVVVEETRDAVAAGLDHSATTDSERDSERYDRIWGKYPL